MAKIHWESVPNVSQEARNANAVVIEALGLPKHKGSGRVAVVGGGPSIRRHVEELRNWDGAVWAVNGTIKWCAENGIDAWFYTADATALKDWVYDLSPVKKAVLAPDICPDVIRSLVDRGVEVTLTGPIQSGPTSANASDYLTIECGYASVTYFGCEGSFEDSGTHAFSSAPLPDWMMVEVAGEYYKTKAEFISQAIMLANVIKAFPHIYSEKSGGLLTAMVEHGPEFDVYSVAQSLYDKLEDRAA